MKKLVATAMIAAMSVSMLAGCGSTETSGTGSENGGASSSGSKVESSATGEAEKVSIKVWCPQNQVDTGIMAEQQEAFAALHPEWDITWTTEVVGDDKAKDEILKDVEAAGDVFFFANDQLTGLVEAGAIARLGGEAETLVNEQTAESVIPTAKVGDAVYGIPYTHNTFYMYYDKTLLTEDDIKTVEGIMAAETADNVYNFYFESAGGWKLGAWYYGAGLSVFGEDGSDLEAGVDWNSEKGIAVTEYLIDLINNPKTAYDGEISVSELVADHRLGAWFDGSWNDNNYVSALGDDLGRAVIPTFHVDGTDYQLKGFYGSKLIGVNAHAQNMQAAVAFATFLGNADNQTLRYEKSAQIPANLIAADTDAVKADELATVIIDEANNASIMQPTASVFGNRYWNYANTIPTEIRAGEMTHDNVQARMDNFVSAMTAE